MRRIVFTFIILLTAVSAVFAQQGKQVPFDSKVRVGKLSNGLTYYIRHNELPRQRAEFYLAQKVGSILEEENQRGLAHFLEHMCFNGTKNFPGNSLVKELESKGVKFGENLNAYTGIDETVYNLSNIPVTREGLIDTALLVLHDWSGFVSLTDKEIDDERGVIREEWRTRNTGDNRVMEETIKNILPGSQYAERMPIGLIEVINTFLYKAIRDYYRKWYRPDLQAIIVVGDIDVDRVEAKIKELFVDIAAPVNPAKRKIFEVPNNTEPIVSIASDPEVQRTVVSVFCKRNVVPETMKGSTDYYTGMLLEGLISSMFNQRMYELSQKPNPPFNGARGGMGDFYVAKTKRAWSLSVDPRNNGDGENALRTILTENERMKRHGFTASELERAKTNLLRNYESAYSERNKRENSAFVKEYVKHFTRCESLPGIEWEYEYVKTILPGLTLNQVNGLARTFVSDTNIVFVVTGPRKESVVLPTREKILTIWNEVKKTNIDPYAEKQVEKPLLDRKPVSGKIIKTEQQPFGYTRWTLSNGAKVLVKRTDFMKDQVIMSAYSVGGISLIEDIDLPSALAINSVVPLGGVGQLSQVDLGKVLTGKKVSISPLVTNLSEGIGGSASPKDFETLLQLTYLYFTQPRMDQDAFNTWKSRMKFQLENTSLNPMNSLMDTLSKIITNNNPRGKQFNLEMLNKVDYSKVMSLYKERYANAGDFTFLITGNIEPDSIKSYVETYLGGLPSAKHKEEFIDRGIYPPKGIVKNNFSRSMETPKSTVVVMYTGEIPATLQNMVLMSYLKSILNIIYTENIREKEGGTYGVSVGGDIKKFPKESFAFQIQFDTDPAKKDKLLSIVYDEIKKITEQNPSEENVKKVKEHTLKKQQEQLINNSYWHGVINAWVVNGFDLHSDYEKVVSSITPSMIRDYAKKVFSQGNIIEVSMNPK